MNLKLLVPLVVCLVLGAACRAEDSAALEGAEFEAAVASAAASHDASFIVRARLRAGSTGEQAGQLGEKYSERPVVIGTRGDDGNSVALLLAPGASADQADAVSNDLSQEMIVEQVSVERLN